MKGPALVFSGKKIPLLKERRHANLKPKNGLYFDSEIFTTEMFYVNEETRQIVVYDTQSGILEMKMANVPAFCKELMEIWECYGKGQ